MEIFVRNVLSIVLSAQDPSIMIALTVIRVTTSKVIFANSALKTTLSMAISVNPSTKVTI